ncbi:MAG TPA: TonB-dependent receptor [Opitutaceae bacterium]|nr:TonB-dependent receptor [Opitutaceae bacterium]
MKQLSVEELVNVEVTSVSKEPEKLLDAPSAIQVITDDDIQRSGATNIPEALRLADNLEVTQKDTNDWGISARGFNTQLADKLLVLMDGRAIYSPLYGGVVWNVQDYLLEDIDRIEVISGPGGTLWGANAVNGVINITTKSAKDTQGTYVEEAAGNYLEDQTAVRYGGILSPNIFYRVYAEYSKNGHDDLGDGTSAGDSLEMARAGFRVDSEATPQTAVTLQGDLYNGTQGFGAAGSGRVSGANLLGRYSRTLSDDSSATLQAYYDHTYLATPYVADAAAPYFSGFPASSLVDTLDTYDIDFQHNIHVGSYNRIVWGLGYRRTHENDEDLSIVRFSPPTLDQNLYSGFIQDEIELRPNLTLTIGSKVEHNDYTGYEYEPSGRLQWNFADKQMLWGAVSRALRTPSRYDRDLEVLTGLQDAPAGYTFPKDYLDGSDNFQSESVIAYELGYRAQLTSRASLSISTYYNNYSDVRSTSATATTATYPFPFPIYFQNNLEAQTYGVELSANYQILDWWQLHAGYDILHENIHVDPNKEDTTYGTGETADPRNQFSLRSSMDLPHSVEFDAAFRWVDKLTINDGPTNGYMIGTVPSYAELDLHLAWHATNHLELSIVGQNLLHNHHAEYGYPTATREEPVRGAYGKVEWRY